MFNCLAIIIMYTVLHQLRDSRERENKEVPVRQLPHCIYRCPQCLAEEALGVNGFRS